MQQESKCVAKRIDNISDSLFKNQSLTKETNPWIKDLYERTKLAASPLVTSCSVGENTSASYSYNDLKI